MVHKNDCQQERKINKSKQEAGRKISGLSKSLSSAMSANEITAMKLGGEGWSKNFSRPKKIIADWDSRAISEHHPPEISDLLFLSNLSHTANMHLMVVYSLGISWDNSFANSEVVHSRPRWQAHLSVFLANYILEAVKVAWANMTETEQIHWRRSWAVRSRSPHTQRGFLQMTSTQGEHTGC